MAQNSFHFRSLFRRTENGAQIEPRVENNNAHPNENGNSYEFNTQIGSSYLNMVTRGARVPAPYTAEQVRVFAQDPMNNISTLREWARWAYYSNGTVTTAIDSLTSLFPLNYVIVSRAKREGAPAAMDRKKVNKLNAALHNMRYKEVIRDSIFRNANDGMYVGYLETRSIPANRGVMLDDIDVQNISEVNMVGMNVMVVPLPIEYTRIIGRRNNCYEAAFDLRYFDQFVSERDRKRKLQGFPKQIQDAYQKYQSGGFSSGACWLRLDWRRTIVTKVKSGMTDPYGVPFAIAALDDVEYAKYFINTKRKVLDTVNNQVYYETFPEGKEKGSSSLTKDQQKNQHETVKQALTTKSASGISFFSLASGTKMDRLPVDISLLDEENENAITNDVNEDLGVSAAALNGNSTGNYATATLNMEIVSNNVFSWIEAVVEELNKCLNYNVIRDRDHLIEFRILPVTFTNREKWVSNLGDLYARGKGSLLAWIAAAGVNPYDYISLMEYELAEDYENKYPVHKTSFTITGKDAPEYEDVDHNLGGGSQSTESTVANNGNASPSPSDG